MNNNSHEIFYEDRDIIKHAVGDLSEQMHETAPLKHGDSVYFETTANPLRVHEVISRSSFMDLYITRNRDFSFNTDIPVKTYRPLQVYGQFPRPERLSVESTIIYPQTSEYSGETSQERAYRLAINLGYRTLNAFDVTQQLALTVSKDNQEPVRLNRHIWSDQYLVLDNEYNGHNRQSRQVHDEEEALRFVRLVRDLFQNRPHAR